MANAAHYLIFHPERDKAFVSPTALVQDKLHLQWHGNIWIDKPRDCAYSGVCNEDPFVLTAEVDESLGWLYSYCHATQLKRVERKKCAFVQPGSILFFCDGDRSKDGTLENLYFDTVFKVGCREKWQSIGEQLPERFSNVQISNPELWKRHFQSGLNELGEEGHKGHFTYIASMYDEESKYSYLPLNELGNRVSISLSNLEDPLRSSIEWKFRGYPVELTQVEAKIINDLIDRATRTKIIGAIRRTGMIY